MLFDHLFQLQNIIFVGKPTGFLEYERKVSTDVSPKQRIKNFKEFHEHLSTEEQQLQGAVFGGLAAA